MFCRSADTLHNRKIEFKIHDDESNIFDSFAYLGIIFHRN